MARFTSYSSLNIPNTWWRMFHIAVTKQTCVLSEYAGGLVFDIVNATIYKSARSDVLSLGQCSAINIRSDSRIQKWTVRVVSALIIGCVRYLNRFCFH